MRTSPTVRGFLVALCKNYPETEVLARTGVEATTSSCRAQDQLVASAKLVCNLCPRDGAAASAATGTAATPAAGRYRRREKDWRRPARTLSSALSEIGIVARIECVTYRVENGTAESQRVYAGTGVVKDVRIAIKALRGARATVHRVGTEPAALSRRAFVIRRPRMSLG